MNKEIQSYHVAHKNIDQAIFLLLYKTIDESLVNAEHIIWHGHPVWFIEENPIVGYCVVKNAVQLLFWSGQSFDEINLKKIGKFKAAEIKYESVDQIVIDDFKKWLQKSIVIQWDYKNLVKRKGELLRLK